MARGWSSLFAICKLEIMSTFNSFFSDLPGFFTSKSDTLSIFEVYPQSEIPLITQIAHINWHYHRERVAFFLPDILVFRVSIKNRIDFRVVDYRTNCSTSFSATFFSSELDGELESFNFKVFFFFQRC